MQTDKIPRYNISKAELYRAGEILRDEYAILNSQEWDDAYELLGKWRTMHTYPLNTFQANIRTNLKKMRLEGKAIVAQRLKRLPSILLKLSRFPTMRMERMQDIGGIRIILPTIEDVYKVRNSLAALKWKHLLKREKDYIEAPQDSGYRSVHMVYSYDNRRAPAEFQGLCVEIQIRTKLQHIWATAVETIGTFIEHSLKSSQGPQEWLDYLKLASAIFAIEEGTTVHASFKELEAKDLVSQFYEKTVELKAFPMLDTFHRAVQFNEIKRFKNKYILLKLDLANNLGFAHPFNKNELDIASHEYGVFEKSRKKDQDAVLVSSRSLSELRKAYPNYFNDTSGFIKQMARIFKKYDFPEIDIPNSDAGDK
ncbi:MAG TPA: RelA/SpoT domain-containing protein [Victivallis vadensis]|jgi:putative GTP pyrophosphokinase|nr:RelA/SpoT domain-containing protein [Victivallis vadensis]